MPAYLIFGLIEVTDPEGFATYRAASAATMAGRDVRFLAGPGIAETLEGTPLLGGVVLEFPSVAEARVWYDSPAYQEAAQVRWGASKCFAMILDGHAPN